MNRKEMLDTYGSIELTFTSWYKNDFTLNAVDKLKYPNLKVIFSPDYRDDLSLCEVNTIDELTSMDDHNHLHIFDPEEVYYSRGEDVPIWQYLEENKDG